MINRGNYRRDLLINEGAHLSFERCLFEACERCGWVLEGYCVMTNHFHLVIRTPEGNLVYEDLKSAQWKVMLAAVLKRHTSAPNVWITRMLNMGIPQAVSQNVGKLRASDAEDSEAYRKLQTAMTQSPS